ncbi:MAG: type I-B CRISPR-associated protein Cas8b1/Cst1 [Anaerolineales bacterium]|nr:type I-B CRISPR-associated protein Cas8b1/Cst1 [Anaerolineales bacterium]
MQELKYTGHPLVDVGLATITAFARKDRPEQLNEADLESIANYMAENYTVNPLRSYLTVAFPNSGFTQPAFFTQPAKQEIYKARVLRAYEDTAPRLEEPDPFMGLAAANLPFDADVEGKLMPGRAFRQHIPLLTAEDVINFHPYGEAGLPVSGEALLAIQALPLGSAKCEGRLLFVHSDNPEIIRHFAGKFLEENRRLVGLAREAGSSKMPEPDLKYRTLLIHTLLEAREMQLVNEDDEKPFSITAYHLTNSGQGVGLNLYHLPNQIVLYLKQMRHPDYESAWNQLVYRAWEITKAKKGEKEAPPPSRNYLYEDLFKVADDPYRGGPQFIRTYFLRDPFRFAKAQVDPRGSYSLRQERELVSWKLTKPFLKGVLYMENERIENIRNMGDALADYVKSQNDRRFFRNFYVLNRYDLVRNELIKANKEYARRGHPPFLTLDGYISVFEEGEELARVDWKLARDLVLIRMVEQLHANGWLGANQELLAETQRETETDNE